MDGPTVVRGLLAGLAATGAMAVIEIAARSRWGLEGVLDWQENQAIAARIARRTVEDLAVPGLGFHFLHGVLAGIVFVLVLPLFRPELPLWVLGPGYGVVLFAIALVIHKPITRRAPWSGALGSVALGVSLLAHVVYGGALTLLVVWP